MLFLLAAAVTIPLDLYLPALEDNPLTAESIEQGRRLFFDRRLSRDGSIACSSCHDPERAFSDGRPVAVGVFDRKGRRNSPVLSSTAAMGVRSSGMGARQPWRIRSSSPSRTSTKCT